MLYITELSMFKIVRTIVVISIIINCAMINAMQQRAVIYPFLEQASIVAIKKTMDKIEKKGLGYPDYSGRLGGIWTDFVVNAQNPSKMTVCENTVKLTEVNGKLQQHNPECMFSYPKIQKIVGEEILPKMFYEIKSRGWAQLPPLVSAQLFILAISLYRLLIINIYK